MYAWFLAERFEWVFEGILRRFNARCARHVCITPSQLDSAWAMPAGMKHRDFAFKAMEEHLISILFTSPSLQSLGPLPGDSYEFSVASFLSFVLDGDLSGGDKIWPVYLCNINIRRQPVVAITYLSRMDMSKLFRLGIFEASRRCEKHPNWLMPSPFVIAKMK
jgi:hypothetical protein